MQNSLMVGLTQADMQAVVSTYDLNDFYYPTLFPLRETHLLTWKMIEVHAGIRLAADLVSRGNPLTPKARTSATKLSGEIPKISIAREKNETDLTDYDLMIASASPNTPNTAMVEAWAEDTRYCWESIAARAEWIALQQISLGKVAFTEENNASTMNQFNVDYLIPAAQKIGVATPYHTTTDGKPLSKDFPKALKIGRDKHGVQYKYAFMNIDTFAKLINQDEVIKNCASLLHSVAGISNTPDLSTLNAFLARRTEIFRGLQIILIDQNITLEQANGTRITGNPFADDVILFSESKTLGNTFWKAPIDLKLPASDTLKVLHGHTLIKKYAKENPVKEVTEGIANLFPTWTLAPRSLLMQISSQNWNLN